MTEVDPESPTCHPTREGQALEVLLAIPRRARRELPSAYGEPSRAAQLPPCANSTRIGEGPIPLIEVSASSTS